MKSTPPIRRRPPIKPARHEEEFIRAAEIRPEPTEPAEPEEIYPWEAKSVRCDVKKQIPLRISEPLFLKLTYISDCTPLSVNALCVEMIERALESGVEGYIDQVIDARRRKGRRKR